MFIVLIGLPGSGKSTFIKNFLSSQDKEFVVMSTDNVIDELCAKEGITYTEGFQKFIGQATARVNQNLKSAINAKKNIIIDQTNMSVKSRKPKLDLAVGYHKIAVVFSVDEETLQTRLKNRSEKTGKHIPDFVMDSMKKSFQEPSKSEGFDVIKLVKQ